MPAEVKLPGVGGVSHRALWIGGGAAVLVMALLWWRQRSTTPDTSAAAGDATGLDAAGLAGGAVTATDLPVASNPTSNPQWTALVMQDLAGVIDPAALSQALGLYLTGSAVNAAQTALIDQAIAVAGYPPVAGPSGYPPAIRTQVPTGQTPPPPPPPPPAPGPAPKPAPASHVVVHGDTLDSIARGWHTSAAAVYNRNAAAIESAAHHHGHASSEHGHWIFPGTRLYKP